MEEGPLKCVRGHRKGREATEKGEGLLEWERGHRKERGASGMGERP